MILADTSVVIAHYRTPTVGLHGIIQANAAAVCGVTVAEVYAGARTPSQLARCAAILGIFQQASIPDAVWELTGRHQALLRAAGVNVPLLDTAIAAVALARGLELWTYDAHFALMQRVLSGLRLFQEPP